jgi:hypothetical protein
MSFKLLTTAVALSTVSLSYARTFTVKNNCAETIWPAVGVLNQIDDKVLYIPQLFTDLNVAANVPDHPTG